MLGRVLFAVAGLLWTLIPLYDRKKEFQRRARTATWFGWFVVVALLVFTIWGYADV